eukprot:6287869-Amphidinium_carterae.4
MNAAKLEQYQLRAITSNAFVGIDSTCENPSSTRSCSEMGDKDWITIVGDVLPVKRHHQHTMAILKCAWFMTLGEKNLYIHMPSSDAKTPISFVPYDNTEKAN